MPHPDEKILWQSLKEGDAAALSLLFQRHYQMLYDYGMKICGRDEFVRDCIQDVFVSIWENRERLAEVNSVPAYLLASQRHRIFRKLKTPFPLLNGDFGEMVAVTLFTAEDFAIREENEAYQRAFLTRALQHIPERMREALYLKTFGGLSYKEISEVMGISSQVARNYVCEAFQRLRKMAAQLPDK